MVATQTEELCDDGLDNDCDGEADEDCPTFTDCGGPNLIANDSFEAGLAGLWPGVLYLFFYSQVVLFAMARNAMAIPYSWLVRPRFFVYGCIPVAVYGWPVALEVLLWVVSLLLAGKTLTGFVKIRGRI